MSGPNIVSTKRREQAKKHASRGWLCNCGKVFHGNSGISSHKRACAFWAAAMAAKATSQQGGAA